MPTRLASGHERPVPRSVIRAIRIARVNPMACVGAWTDAPPHSMEQPMAWSGITTAGAFTSTWAPHSNVSSATPRSMRNR